MAAFSLLWSSDAVSMESKPGLSVSLGWAPGAGKTWCQEDLLLSLFLLCRALTYKMSLSWSLLLLSAHLCFRIYHGNTA